MPDEVRSLTSHYNVIGTNDDEQLNELRLSSRDISSQFLLFPATVVMQYA